MNTYVQMGTKTWILLWMGVWSWEDIRKHSMPSWQLLLVSLIGMFIQQRSGQLFSKTAILGMALGILLEGVGRLTGGSLGGGDAWIVGIIGLQEGGGTCLFILMGGLFMASVYSMYLMIHKKKSRKTAIAFVPFLAAAYGIYWFSQMKALLP
jgi:leader peptidase (prepilin peptidase)/N-methyltransferase